MSEIRIWNPDKIRQGDLLMRYGPDWNELCLVIEQDGTVPDGYPLWVCHSTTISLEDGSANTRVAYQSSDDILFRGPYWRDFADREKRKKQDEPPTFNAFRETKDLYVTRISRVYW